MKLGRSTVSLSGPEQGVGWAKQPALGQQEVTWGQRPSVLWPEGLLPRPLLCLPGRLSRSGGRDCQPNSLGQPIPAPGDVPLRPPWEAQGCPGWACSRSGVGGRVCCSLAAKVEVSQ